MKYFTPPLIAMGRSEDDAVLDEQDRLWDEAGERYRAHLDGVRPHLPPGLRQVLDHYYLHDAVVHGMGEQGRLFVIVLRLDTPPHSLLTFEYDLVEDPVIDRDALPAPLRYKGAEVSWQYDEVEMVPGTLPTWVQSVLFDNGWEVRLHFRDVRVREVQPLIPSAQPAAVAPATLSPSA
jgi:hypothetical protein